MDRWLAGLVCLVILDVVSAQEISNEFEPPDSKPKIAYRSPEYFSPDEDYGAFREHVQEFLQDQPYHILAPRALYDLIQIHGLRPQPDQNLINGLKARLALEYPESLATSLLLKSFKDQSEFRSILVAEFRKKDQDFSSEFCRRFLAAAERGLRQFGPPFLSDDGFQVQIRLALSEARSFHLGQHNEAHFVGMKEPSRTALSLCRQAELSPVERVLGLHNILLRATPDQEPQLPCVRDAERFWMYRLTAEDRQLPRIRSIVVEQHLVAREFEKALPEVNQLLAAEVTPQWLYWRGWCLANRSQTDEAITCLESVAKRFPQDAWSGPAQELAAALRNQQQAIIEQSEVLQEFIAELNEEQLEQLRIAARYSSPNRKSLELLAHANAVENTLEAMIQQAGLPFVGYRASLKEYDFFIKDNPEVIRIAKPGTFPDLKLWMQPGVNGMAFSFRFDMYSTEEAAQSWRKAILSLSRPLANREAIEAILRQYASGTGFPLSVKRSGERRVLVWLLPEINRPQCQRFELDVGPRESHDLELRWTEVLIHLQHGKQGTLSPVRSPWERLPVAVKTDLAMAELMRAMALAATLMNPLDPSNAPEPSANPQQNTRTPIPMVPVPSKTPPLRTATKTSKY